MASRKRLLSCLILLISGTIFLYTGCSKLQEPVKIQSSSCGAGDCHFTSPLGESRPTSGQHNQHRNAGYICENCHGQYLDDTNHMNGIMDKDNNSVDIVLFDQQNSSTGWAPTSSNCTNITCHGGGNVPINWYNPGATGCQACHSGGGSNDPTVTSGEGVDGKHITHSGTLSIGCELCHLGYKGQPAHLRPPFGRLETNTIIYPGGTYAVGGAVSYTFVDNTGSCDSISCHGGSGNVNWYSPGTTGCLTCHSGTGYVPSSNNHPDHVTSENIDCDVCHNNYKPNGNHMNGSVDIPSITSGGSFNSTSVTFNFAGGNCDTISCHGGNPAPVNWTAVSLKCTDCHAAGTSIVPGGSGVSGKHDAHIAKMPTVDGETECNLCHNNYTGNNNHINGVWGSAETDTLIYPNGSFGGSAITYTFDDNTKACATVSCHGGGSGLEWDGSLGGCNDCHSSGTAYDPTTINGTSAAGKHVIHNDKGIDCRICHKDYYGKATHADGSRKLATDRRGTPVITKTDIMNFDTPPVIGWPSGTSVNSNVTVAGSDMNCDTITCHGGTTAAIEWYGDTVATPTDCSDCHNASATGSNMFPSSSEHTVHISGGKVILGQEVNCSSCHNGYRVTSSHGDGSADTPAVSFDPVLNPAGTFNSGNKECSGLGCHDMTDTAGGTADWNPGGNQLKCESCHKPGSIIDPLITAALADKGKHYAHVGNKSLACNKCHPDYPDGTTPASALWTGHMNGNYGHSGTTPETNNYVIIGGGETGNWLNGAKTCDTVSCHGGATAAIDWYAGSTGCNACHVAAGSTINPMTQDGFFPGGSEGKAKHILHINEGISCENCHVRYDSDIVPTNNQHMNSSYGRGEEVPGAGTEIFDIGTIPDNSKWPGTTDVAINFNITNGDCSNISCHGGTNSVVNWYASYISDCLNCHTAGATAADGSSIDPNNLDTPGSHGKHLAQGYVCSDCHNSYNDQAGHGDGILDASNSISFDSDYSDGDYIPGTNTCSGTGCHYSGTPQWGGTVACGDCHSNTNPGTGSHTKHVDSTGSNYSFACVKCHDDGNNVQNGHHTRAGWEVNGSITVTFDGDADKGPGSASFNSGTKVCSNTYCHGDFDGGKSNLPDWDAQTGGVCGDCHDTAPLKAAYGSHDKHTDAASSNYDCSVCHNGYGSGNEASANYDSASTHVNFVKNVSFDAAVADIGPGIPATYNSTDKQCANTYCHGDFAGGLNVTADWDARTGGVCGDCHSSTNPGSGLHDKHTAGTAGNYNYACSTCHNDPAKHGNGIPGDISFDANADKGPGIVATYNSTDKQCANTYCHGDFDGGKANASDWDNPAGGTCGDCHDIAPLKSGYGSHDKHTDAGLGNNDCSVCHSGYATGNEASANYVSTSTHADFTKNVLFDNAVADRGFGTPPSYVAGSKQCSNVYCHGDFTGGLNVTADWDDITGGVCGNCHSDTNPGTGLHNKHTEGSGGNYDYACTNCHNDSAKHADGTLGDINFDASADKGPGTAAAYNSTDKQCSNTYCHGDFNGGRANIADWDNPAGGACGDCHDIAPLTASYGSHNKHTDAGLANYSCSVCHNGIATGNEGTASLTLPVTSSTHANFINEVNFDTALTDRGYGVISSYNSTEKQCSNVYCHGDYTGGLNFTADWDARTGGACGNCHSDTNPGTGRHNKHTAGTAGNYNYSCLACHNDSTKHVDGNLGDISFDANADLGPGTVATYNSGTRECSNTYCHGDFSGGKSNVADWDDNLGGLCGNCHGIAPAKSTYGSHDQHTDSALSNYDCSVCHNGFASGNEATAAYTSTSTHADFSKNVSFDASVADIGPGTPISFNSGTKQCSNTYCHGDFTGGLNVTADWDNVTGGACGDCHSTTNPGTGAHAKHVEGSGGNYSFACTTCHNDPLKHGNGILGDISFDANANKGPNTATYNSVSKECSNTYCHGDFEGGNTNVADWDNTLGGTCGDCHELAPFSSAYGSHDKHTDSGSANYNCSVCHNGIVTGREGTAALTLPVTSSTHANYTKDINFDAAVADIGPGTAISFNSGSKECSNSYCHGDFTGGLNFTADWDAKTGGSCGDCHSDTNTGTGLHDKHTSGLAGDYDYACETCHNDTTKHADGTLGDISFDANADKGPGTVASYNSGTKECSNTYCHGDFPGGKSNVADWDAASGGTCGDCHDNAPLKAAYGSHDKHTDAGSSNINCSACHSGYATGNEGTAAYVSTLTHANFNKNVNFDAAVADRGYGALVSFNFTDKKCSNSYCHGDFSGGLNVTADWDARTGGVCGDCHSSTNPGTGVHDKHTAGTAGNYDYACTTCHNDTSKHSDGNLGDISFNANADKGPNTAAFNSTDKQCSNTYCHGDFDGGKNVVADWDAPSGGICGDCHDNAPLKAAYGSHDKHTDSAQSDYDCSVCHNGYATGKEATAAYVSTSTHADYTKNVSFEATFNPGATYTSGTKTCNTLYCHGNFTGGNSTAPKWTGYTVSCGVNVCHNGSNAYNNAAHAYHVVTRQYACDKCHTGNTHADKTKDVAFDAFNPGSSYNSTDNTCSSLYCHGNFTGNADIVAVPANKPDWYDNATGDCLTCHSTGTPTTGSHTKHISSPYSYACIRCHTTFGHVDGTFGGESGVGFDTVNPNGTYAGGTDTCGNLYCHGNTTGSGDWNDFDYSGSANNANPVWGGAAACGSCHDASAAALITGQHDKHIGNNTGTEKYNYECHRCHENVITVGGSLQANHADGALQVKIDTDTDLFGTAAAYDYTTNQCASTYCHGNFTGGNTATADWDVTSTGDCGTCHNIAPRSFGLHETHTSVTKYNYDCKTCHNNEVSGNESTAAFTSIVQHADYTIDVNFDTKGDQGPQTAADYDVAPLYNCNNTFCHGDFASTGNTAWNEGNALNAPAWNVTSSGDCGTCHGTTSGNNAGLGIPNSNNVWDSTREDHVKHAGVNASSGYQYPCGFCHEGIYDAILSTGDGIGGVYETGIKSPDYTQHADGVRTALNFYSPFTTVEGTKTYNGLQDVNCSSIYCHSDGWDPGDTTPNADPGGTSNPRWGSSNIGCTDCHNGGNNTNNGANSSRIAPSHEIGNNDHYNRSCRKGCHGWEYFGHQTACEHCHGNTTFNSAGVPSTMRDNTMRYTLNRHVNRWKNVSFGSDADATGGDHYYTRDGSGVGGQGGTCYVDCHTSGAHNQENHNPEDSWYYTNPASFKGYYIYEVQQ